MRHALARHDAVVTACVRRQQGHVVKSKGEGDSVFAVFVHARDAVTAALVIQCALGAEQWQTSTPIRVRMAIHTGQVELRDGDYYGPTVNRGARLRALARGGQVLLSGVAAKLTHTQLPPGAGLKDLGTHPLKDLSAPERVFQLTHPQLPSLHATEPAPAASAPVATKRAYVVTDHMNRAADGRQWGPGERYRVGDVDERIRCFTSPTIAAFMNGLDERIRMPKLWEVNVDEDVVAAHATVGCRDAKAVRIVPLPPLTGMHFARFAVLCARAAYADGMHGEEFVGWADGWLTGQDNSGISARELADELERAAERGSGMSRPEELMAANAGALRGACGQDDVACRRARDEEAARAIDHAAEAVHFAMRFTKLDLPAMAEQAMHQIPAALPTARVAPTIAATRILTALPT